MANEVSVFVSYNSNDHQIVEGIVRQLKSHGIKLFFDKHTLSLGDDVIDTIENALKDANCFLVFVGKHKDGPWQNMEVKSALNNYVKDKTKKIIPVLLPEADASSLPGFLESFHRTQLDSLFDFAKIDAIINQLNKSKLTPVYETPNGKTEDNTGKPLGFKAHTEKIIELLVGESIYQSKFVAIRELVQNAVDACERRAGRPSGEVHNIEIIVAHDNSTIEISDNGEGMDINLLKENFIAIGKSVNEEVRDENIRKKLIGKFGIGFISTFMIAKSIEISTQYSQKEQINFTVTSPSELFIYHDASTIKRPVGYIGTSIRVNIKNELMNDKDFDILKYLKTYCRHVPYIKVSILKNGSILKANLDNNNWNTYDTVISKQFVHPNFILCLGISKTNLELISSNYGFLIGNYVENIIPDHFPKFIGGEINFEPNAIKLNIARNDIINGEILELDTVKKFINNAVREIIILFYKMPDKDNEAKRNIRNLLLYYLSNDNKTSIPLTEVECIEMLKGIWELDYSGRTVTMKYALDSLKAKKLKRLYYWENGAEASDFFPVIKETLYKRGFLLIQNESRTISINKAPQSSYNIYKALKVIAQSTKDFELRDLNNFHKDDFIPEEDKDLHPLMYEVARDIKKATKIIIKFCKLGDNKIYITFNDINYINSEDDVIQKLNRGLLKETRRKDHVEFFFEIFFSIEYV